MDNYWRNCKCCGYWSDSNKCWGNVDLSALNPKVDDTESIEEVKSVVNTGKVEDTKPMKGSKKNESVEERELREKMEEAYPVGVTVTGSCWKCGYPVSSYVVKKAGEICGRCDG